LSKSKQAPPKQRESEARFIEMQNQQLLIERIAELEQENVGWNQLTSLGEMEFSRAGLRDITRLARLYYLKNPLVNRGVNVQALYVWAQGVEIEAEAEEVNEVIQDFLEDPKNKAELTSHQAQTLTEVDLEVTGNLFLVLFVDMVSGRVRIRSIPMTQADEIICNPEDAKEPWYYKRVWSIDQFDMSTGVTVSKAATVYYPDWQYKPKNRPPTIAGHETRWNEPVYHVKVGALKDMRFGLSEVYQALDWAKAYKSFLENWSTIMQAYARFAMRLTTPGGKAGIAAAKAKLGTTLTQTSGETNPPPLMGSTFIGLPGANVEPIKTAGATTSAESGRPLKLMAATAVGLPETFFGDASVGTLATAKSLDRPTELKFVDRQQLWRDILQDICQFVIDASARATRGKLKGKVALNDFGDETVILTGINKETGEQISRRVTITFPPILERDMDARINAIVTAATLDGKAQAGTMDTRTLVRLLLTALGVEDVDELLDKIAPVDETGMPTPQAQEAMTEAVKDLVKDLREALLVS
jgi:hypothetical protein